MQIFLKAADILLIIFGSLIAAHMDGRMLSTDIMFSGSQVAFTAALALSVLPAFGCYVGVKRLSVLGLMFRTVVAWIAVQICGVALLHLIHDEATAKSNWFIYWSIVSCFGLVIFRPITEAVVRGLGLVGKQLRASAHGVSLDAGNASPVTRASSFQRIMKRALDVVLSVLLMIGLLPLLLLVSIVIKRDGGAVFFGHVRIGRNGKKFRCMKFRTMIPNADLVLAEVLAVDPVAREEWEREYKLKDDFRVTRIGRVLRATSMDELPQLWNVLRGDMSLVGPRPIVEGELPRYGENVSYYLSATPGMTGLWQVSGRNDVDYATRVVLDTAYVKNWSLRQDFRILLKTFDVVLRRSGAY